mmetsp:Transcript_80752/g.147258  ORF Transcript_80752/g.147258 Transcript_80752/m.147258 type:complete len:465 (+) Transcript_80752:111-1505(+)
MFPVLLAGCTYAATASASAVLTNWEHSQADADDHALIQTTFHISSLQRINQSVKHESRTKQDAGTTMVPVLTAEFRSSHDYEDRMQLKLFMTSDGNPIGKGKHKQLAAGAFAVLLFSLSGFCLTRKMLPEISTQDDVPVVSEMKQCREALGMFSVAIGATLGSIANAFDKLLSHMPLLQVLQTRFLLQSVCAITAYILLCCYGYPVHILGRPGNRLLLVARAITSSGSLALLWAAVTIIPLGETTAFVYLSPIICGLLAYAFLGERLGCAFAAHAAVSFFGVLLVAGVLNSDFTHDAAATNVHGGGEYRVQGIFLAVASAGSMAVSNILLRLLKDTVVSWEILICQDILSALVFVPCAQVIGQRNYLLDWSAWSFHDAMLLSGFIAAGMTASLFVITGFSLAPAGKAAPFTYCEVCSAFVIQICIFGQVPQRSQLVGISLILLSTLCRAWYELRVAEPQDKEES